MPTTTDQLGTWDDLGTVLMADDWVVFPEQILNCDVFRFTYFVDWQKWNNREGFRSRALIQFYYPIPESQIVGESRILFPKQEQEIREFKLPQDFEQSGMVVRGIAAKRLVNWREWVNPPPDLSEKVIPWSLKIEALF